MLFRTFLRWFYSNIFCAHHSCVSGKIVSRVFSPIFWSRYLCKYKKTFIALCCDDFFPTFIARTIRVFLEKNISPNYLPPNFWSRDSCEYKKSFFSFLRRFFPNILCSHYWFVPGNIISCVFSPHFFGHDIRVNIKNVFSHFFATIFFQHFMIALFVCFWKNYFVRFSPHFFVHDIPVNIKKRFLHFLATIFFPNIFARTIRVFL